MFKRHGSFLAWLLLTLLVLVGSGAGQFAWGADRGPASSKPTNGKPGRHSELKDTQNQTAAIRKSKGQMRSTTSDDRWAAAKRNADRHARAVAKGKGGDK
jgi:hypothetical protein